MPFACATGCSLYYETDGTGPTVVFVNEVGYGAWLWGWQYTSLSGPFETVVFDPRGTGRSELEAESSVGIETLAADVEAVLSDHGARRVHLVGAGLGGMVALAYAREYDRARSLTLMGTALNGNAVTGEALDVMGKTEEESLEPCFSDVFLEEREIIDRILDWRNDEDASTEIREAQANAMRAFTCERPYEITIPTLVLHGTDDPLIPAEAGNELATALPNGRFETLSGRHLAFIETSKHANDAIMGFLESITD